MRLFLLACAGGALGAGGRFLVYECVVRWLNLPVFWGTLTVNIVGSFVMGVLTAYIVIHLPAAMGVRIFLATGFLGGFTTFSAFSLDAIMLFERGAHGAAIGYGVASVVLSIGACLVGLLLGRGWFA